MAFGAKRRGFSTAAGDVLRKKAGDCGGSVFEPAMSDRSSGCPTASKQVKARIRRAGPSSNAPRQIEAPGAPQLAVGCCSLADKVIHGNWNVSLRDTTCNSTISNLRALIPDTGERG